MTLADIKNYVYRRTKTTSSDWGTSGADLVIALNNANEWVLARIRQHGDNFYPTAWTTSDLSTGTLSPVFDSYFHELIPLKVCVEYANENAREFAQSFQGELNDRVQDFDRFYAGRQYKLCTVTIATPGVVSLDYHGFQTNDRVIFATTGALPTGLSANTWYYVIYVDDYSFQVTATRSGTAINTSGTQSGTHYVGRETQPRMTVSSDRTSLRGSDSNM